MSIGSSVRTAIERFLFESSVRILLQLDPFYPICSLQSVIFDPFFPIYSIRFVLLDWNRSNCTTTTGLLTDLSIFSFDLPAKLNNSLPIYRTNGSVIGLATAS